MEVKYGILALDVSSGGVVHFVGFEEPPAMEDYVHVYNELATDPDFGLIGKMCSILLCPARDIDIKLIKEAIEDETLEQIKFIEKE